MKKVGQRLRLDANSSQGMLAFHREVRSADKDSRGRYFINSQWIHVIVQVNSPVLPDFESGSAKLGPDRNGNYYEAQPWQSSQHQNGWKQVDASSWEWSGLVNLGENWMNIQNGSLDLTFSGNDQTGHSLDVSTTNIYDTHAPSLSFLPALENLKFNALDDAAKGLLSFNLSDNISERLKLHLRLVDDNGGDVLDPIDVFVRIKEPNGGPACLRFEDLNCRCPLRRRS
jgi:hypothetical protein